MKERFGVGGQALEADVSVAPGRVRVGREVTVTRLPDGSVRLAWPGGSAVAWVVGDEVCIDGRVRAVRRAAAEAPPPPPVVTPPMPAVVGRVLVAVGDPVTRGQPVVTVTAMKMEVTLRAPHDGRVTVVRVGPGDKVAPGDRLVEVEEG